MRNGDKALAIERLLATEQRRDPSRRNRFASYWTSVWTIFVKEIRTEMRAKEVFTTMVVFGFLAAVVLGMAFDFGANNLMLTIVPGILWVIILFAGILGLNRSFGAEVDRGTLSGLLLSPVDRSTVFFGKFAANLLYLLLMELILLPVLLVMFDMNLFQPLILLGLLLGSIGYTGVGTFFAALTAHSRARESMLPILLLPVMVPVFTAGVSLTTGILTGRPMSGLWRWLMMLTLYDLLFIVIAYLVFDLIWEY